MPARSADDVRIETYSGLRVNLRRLFELAGDSADAASTAPGSVAVLPSGLSWPLADEVKPLSDGVPALEANRNDPAGVTQQVAAWPVPSGVKATCPGVVVNCGVAFGSRPSARWDPGMRTRKLPRTR